MGLGPTLLDVGPLDVTWSGLLALAGVAVGALLAVRWLRGVGVSPGQAYGVILWVLIGGLAGARLLHVADYWSYYWALPWEALYIWAGGLALWGAILGAAAGGLLHARMRGMPVWRVADVGALAALLGQAVGRVGDIVGGEIMAKATAWPWGLEYTHPESLSYSPEALAVHPVAAYELLWDLAAFGLLWRLRRRPLPEGGVFLGYLALYAAGRLLIGFARLDRVWGLGLQEAQLVALVVLPAVGLTAWRLRSRRARSPKGTN